MYVNLNRFLFLSTQEIDALLSGGLTMEDEDAVEDELSALIADEIDEQLPEAPTAVENPEVVLPDVPEEDALSGV